LATNLREPRPPGLLIRDCVEDRGECNVLASEGTFGVGGEHAVDLVPPDVDVRVMVSNFGCGTDTDDETERLVEVAEDIGSADRHAILCPPVVLLKERLDLFFSEIRSHTSTVVDAVDPRIGTSIPNKHPFAQMTAATC